LRLTLSPPNPQQAAVGFEPTYNGFANRNTKQAKPLQNKALTENGKTDLACFLASISGTDPDLAAVIRSWPGLSVELKKAIVKIVIE
jgi:hypothetical protein